MKKLIASLMIVVCCLSGCSRAKPENSSANVSIAVTPSPDKTAETNQATPSTPPATPKETPIEEDSETNQATQNTPLATPKEKPIKEDSEVYRTHFHPNNETEAYLLTVNQESPEEDMYWTVYDDNMVKTQTFTDEYLSDIVEFVDVNVDGYQDAVVTLDDKYGSCKIYLWNPEIKGFEAVTYVGFEALYNFEVHDGYLLSKPSGVYNTYRTERLKWEGTSLVIEKPKEGYLFEYVLVHIKGEDTYKLKLESECCFHGTIKLFDMYDNLLQVIEDEFFYMSDRGSDKIMLEDLNFDGYTDIAMKSVADIGNGLESCVLIYTWNPEKKQFERATYKGPEKLSRFQVCDGYIKNEIKKMMVVKLLFMKY